MRSFWTTLFLFAGCFLLSAAPRSLVPQEEDMFPDGSIPKKENASPDKKQEKKPLKFSRQGIGRETQHDSVLVTVSGDVVTLLDVLLETGREEAKLASMFSGERLYLEVGRVRARAVENIITRKLVYAKYKEKPFEIGQQHVEDRIDQLALVWGDGTRATLERKAKQQGTNMEELAAKARESIAVDVMLMEFCDRRVSVTPKQVFEAYQKEPKRWTRSRQLVLQLLLVRREQRKGMPAPEKLCRDLSSLLKGADEKKFSGYVREISEGPNPSAGGKTPLSAMEDLRPEFAEALKNAHPGDIAGPVATPEGFYFIRVVSETPASVLPFEKVSTQIYKELRAEAVASARKNYAEKLKKEAVIRYYFDTERKPDGKPDGKL